MTTKATAVPADHFKQMAKSLRERAPVLKSVEARIEVLALAAEFERRADAISHLSSALGIRR